MRYIIRFLLCLALVLAVPLFLVGKPGIAAGANPTEMGAAAAKAGEESTGLTAESGVEQITRLRWAVQTNAAINDSWLRLVLDVTGPVQADGAVIHTPRPYLAVHIKGAVPGGVAGSVNLDGQMADSAGIDTDGQDSWLMIALSTDVADSDCRIFALPPDAGANKPFRVIVDICKPAPPPGFSFTPGLGNKVIVIDPGHGGSDTGATGPGKTMEKAVTLAVAQQVKALLEEAGAKVILTRQEDCDVFGPQCTTRDELNARVAVGDSNNADIFLSIHANSSLNPLSNGTATYYYKKTAYDALLAYNLQKEMVRAGGLRDRSFFPANFYVVKFSSRPAALVELAFISNPDEERLLNDPQFQQKMAQGMVEGMERFFAQAGT